MEEARKSLYTPSHLHFTSFHPSHPTWTMELDSEGEEEEEEEVEEGRKVDERKDGVSEEEDGIWAAQDTSVQQFTSTEAVTTVLVTDGLDETEREGGVEAVQKALEEQLERKRRAAEEAEEANTSESKAQSVSKRSSKVGGKKKFRYETKNERNKKVRKERSVKGKKAASRSRK